MKRIGLSIVALVSAVCLWAVPAYRGWQTKAQPNGTEITVRQIGDEFFHYWETEDGQIAEEQADGTFVITGERVPTAEQAAAKHQAAKAMHYTPHKAIGQLNLAPRGLLVLVQFSNVSFAAGNDSTAFSNMLNQAGYNYNGATGSAIDYFKAQSNNQYSPAFDVVGPVTLPNTRVYYGEEGTIGGYKQDDMYIADFVIDAVAAADAMGCDFSQYDNDHNGYVDFVYFIYAGKGQANGGTSETIWPHNWELNSALYFHQTHGTSGYSYTSNATNLPTYDGKRINNYACSAELRKDGERSGIGTFCHEFGHVMGLPDYYVTTDDASNKNKYYDPGAWSIMDYGSYNNNEMTPPNYSAFDKYYMGWLTPDVLAKNAQLDVTLTTDYASAYQINGGSTLKAVKTEQRLWYLENRQKTGWDTYLPGHGMLAWEVTYSNSNWKNNAPNNEDVGYTIVTANDITRPYTPCEYFTDENSTSGTPFPGTSNVTVFTPATGCALTNIAENAGVITFKYNGGAVNYWTYEVDATNCTASSESGQVDKGDALNLTITANPGYTLDSEECWAVEMGNDELDYGTGFTYDASSGAFSIPAVTGNVYIIAMAQEVPMTIRWMANGEEYTTTNTSAGGKLVLPATDPTPCDDKVFIGWTATAGYESETTAPTLVKAGDDATETTYYAVYATEGGSSETTLEKATSISVGDKVVFVCENASNEMTSIDSYGVGTSYSGTPAGTLVFDVTAGSTSGKYSFKNGDDYIAWSSGNTLNLSEYHNAYSSWSVTISNNGNATIANAQTSGRIILWNVNSPRFAAYVDKSIGTNFYAIQLYKVMGGITYSDYSTSCIPPTKYAITINETTNGSVTTTPVDEAAAGKTVTITATPDTHYHLATIAVKDAENADVALSGEGNSRTFVMPEKAVTVSASFAEDDKYTVRFFDKGEVISSEQYFMGETAEKPADPTASCAEYTFVGWWTAELEADNTEAKTWVTNFTVTGAQDYYAIYSKTVQSESGLASFDGTNGGTFKIYAQVGETTYYATTISSNKLQSTTTESNAAEFTFKKVDGGFTIKTGEDYLKYSGSKTDVSLQSSAYTWSIEESPLTGYGTWRVNSGTSGRALAFSAGSSNVFGGYATSNIGTTNNGATYYDLEIGGGVPASTTYYSSTVTCATTDFKQVEKVEKAVKVLENGQIILIVGNNKYTIFGQKIQ